MLRCLSVGSSSASASTRFFSSAYHVGVEFVNCFYSIFTGTARQSKLKLIGQTESFRIWILLQATSLPSSVSMPRYTTLYVPEPYRRQFVSTGLITVYTRVICSYQDLCVTIVALAGAGLHGLTQGRQENIVSARSRLWRCRGAPYAHCSCSRPFVERAASPRCSR
jgi:hypothetical protein